MPNVTVYANKENYAIYNRAKVRYGNRVSEYLFGLVKKDMEQKEKNVQPETDMDVVKTVYAAYDVFFGDIEREYTSDNQFLSIVHDPDIAIMSRFSMLHADNPKIYYDVMQVFIKKHPSISKLVKIEIPDEVKVCQLP